VNADRFAVLPFALCQQHGLSVGYERSFKLHRRRVLANRYLLGIPTDQLTLETALQIADQLSMPATPGPVFWDLYCKANLLLIGYEDREPGSVLKLYLEFDETFVAAEGHESDPSRRLLHRGVKWGPVGDAGPRISDYVWRIGHSRQVIERSIEALLERSEPAGPLGRIVDAVFQRAAAEQLRYVDVIESGRRSFDLNVYAAGLTVGDVFEPCHRLMTDLGIDGQTIDRLRGLVADRLLGHLAAGWDARGEPFVTIYFEP
jgi:hypothetical protein